MNGSTTKSFLSRQEATELLGVSLSTLIRHLNDGTIPFTRLGSRILIPTQFIENLTQKALSGQGAK
ncbi:MAG TPA: excisionase family DNA-binding protein [Rectinemataceae bacterium]|nr:excisionase family DNA-binding protein [Rectinemataceae bacterium]